MGSFTPGGTRLSQVFRMAGVAGLVSPLRTSVRGFRSSARRYADAAPVAGIPYSKLNLGVPAETWTNEKRVACTPANTALFTKKGFTVNVQEGAGRLSNFRDEDYAAAGGNIVSKEAAFAQDITLKLRQPSLEEGRDDPLLLPLPRPEPRIGAGPGGQEDHSLWQGLHGTNHCSRQSPPSQGASHWWWSSRPCRRGSDLPGPLPRLCHRPCGHHDQVRPLPRHLHWWRHLHRLPHRLWQA